MSVWSVNTISGLRTNKSRIKMKKSNKIKHARAVMRKAFEEDPDFKRTYIDNVAMYLYDNAFGMDMSHKPTRDPIAEGLIDLIFSE